ncbi:MAG TPA: aminoacyl-tRNA hydrolase [Candidatus Bathyarchaeia archaeon]|nr:aminoacyl-tRNA hydrolase [Candidatus Bathyarchaeia archaeon]
MKTILIVGLGNPGKEYARTRHNAGFMFVDYFWQRFQDEFGFSDWEFSKKLKSEISIGKITAGARLYLAPDVVKKAEIKEAGYNPAPAQRIILLKPQTFMNLSGEAVSTAAKYYKVELEVIIAVHDDVDFALGKYKISKNSTSAGHNGVQNIIDMLGTKDFTRVRIGVDNRGEKEIPTEKYVLGKFTAAEMKIVSKILPEISEKISEIF